MEIDRDDLEKVWHKAHNAWIKASRHGTLAQATDEAVNVLREALLTTAPSDGKAATAEPGEGEIKQWRPTYECDPHKWYEGPEPTHLELHRRTLYLRPAPPSAQPSKELAQEIAAYLESRPGDAHADKLLRRAMEALSQPPVTDAEKGEPIAWESKTDCYIKFVTDSRYQKFSPKVRAWYKPYRCSNCARTEATEEKPLPSSEGDGARQLLDKAVKVVEGRLGVSIAKTVAKDIRALATAAGKEG